MELLKISPTEVQITNGAAVIIVPNTATALKTSLTNISVFWDTNTLLVPFASVTEPVTANIDALLALLQTSYFTGVSPAATSAKQDIGNERLATLATDPATGVKQTTGNGYLSTLTAKDFATAANQTTANGYLSAMAAKDFSTSAKQDTTNGHLSTIAGKDFSTSAKQDAANSTLVSILAKQPTSPATETGVLKTISDFITQMSVLVSSYNGNKGFRVFTGEIDTIDDFPVFISSEHHEIHEGNSFFFASVPASLGNNATLDFLIDVHSGIAPHMVFERDVTAETWVEIFEAPTVTANGTLQTIRNRNRNSANTAGISIYLTPTVTSTGTLLISYIDGFKTSGGGGRESNEFVLKANTKYLYRVTSKNASNNVCERFLWYEEVIS